MSCQKKNETVSGMDSKYGDMEMAHSVIRIALQRCDSWVQRMLETRELRLFWFQFDTVEVQIKTLTLIHTMLLQPNATSKVHEDAIITLVRTALRPETSREALREATAYVPHLWEEIERIEKLYADVAMVDTREYTVIFSTPLTEKTPKTSFMTVRGNQQDITQELYQILAQPGGLGILLNAYKVKIQQSWMPAPHFLFLMRNEIVRHSCRNCEATREKLMQCSKCKVARYCDKSCQAQDWLIHKLYCNEEKDIVQRCKALEQVWKTE